MDSEKYIGLDVHQATIVVAVTDSTGKLVMESILETKAATILQFFAGLRGTLSVTFEEGTWSAWLYDLLNPHVDKLVVCNPRKNALSRTGTRVIASMPASWRSCYVETSPPHPPQTPAASSKSPYRKCPGGTHSGPRGCSAPAHLSIGR
jgi:hypothetical protein